MKTIQILIASIILSFIAKGQDYTDMGTYPAPKYLHNAHDILIDSDQVVLSYSPYSNTLDVVFSLYENVPLKSGAAFTDKKIKPRDGIIRDCYYSGDTITEYVIYVEKSFPNDRHTFVLRNRSIGTMQVLGEEKTLATHSISMGTYDLTRVRLLKIPEGFVFVEFIKDSCSISYLSKDFEKIKKVVISDKKIAEVSCKGCYSLRTHDDGSITFLFPEDKGILNILHITEDGEQIWFSPVDLGAKVDSWALIHNFCYDSNKKEFSWVFLARSGLDDQNGYGIVKWNEDGQIITNAVKMLQDEEIYLLDTDVKRYFEERKKPTHDIWEESVFLNIELLNVANDNYVVVKLIGSYMSFRLNYIIKLDESGGAEWIRPIISEVGTIQSIFPYEYQGKLNLFIVDFTSNSKNDTHFVHFSRKADKSYSFYNMVIDPVDGTELSNKKYDADTGSNSKLISVQLSQEEGSVLVEFLKEKQVTYRQIKW